MRANLDQTVEILDENRHCYHLEVQSRVIDPRKPLDPIIKKRILCLRPVDYKKYFQCSAADQAGYLEAMNLRDCRLVHDPSKETTERVERVPSAEETYRDARKVAEALKSPALKKTKKAVK
jgi:hypothetical protein